MRLRFTKSYNALYRKLPQDIKERADKQLRLLLHNPQHPSLRLQKMKGYGDLWKIRVTMHYRIVFQIEGDRYILRKIGPHDILDRP